MEKQSVIEDIVIGGKSYHAEHCDIEFANICDGCAFDRDCFCGIANLIEDDIVPSCLRIRNGVADIIWIENSPKK